MLLFTWQCYCISRTLFGFLCVISHNPILVGNFSFFPEAAQQKVRKAGNFLEVLVLNPFSSIASVTYLPQGMEVYLSEMLRLKPAFLCDDEWGIPQETQYSASSFCTYTTSVWDTYKHTLTHIRVYVSVCSWLGNPSSFLTSCAIPMV